MPSLKDNFNKKFGNMDYNLDLSEIKTVRAARNLFPIEKMWIELIIYNDLHFRFGDMITKWNPEEIRKALFETTADQDTVDAIIKIYKHYQNKFEIGKNNIKVRKVFRMFATLQGFDATYQDSLIDKAFDVKLAKGDKYQWEKFRSIISYTMTYFATPGMPFIVDELDDDQFNKLINIALWLQAKRVEGGIAW